MTKLSTEQKDQPGRWYKVTERMDGVWQLYWATSREQARYRAAKDTGWDYLEFTARLASRADLDEWERQTNAS